MKINGYQVSHHIHQAPPCSWHHIWFICLATCLPILEKGRVKRAPGGTDLRAGASGGEELDGGKVRDKLGSEKEKRVERERQREL